MTADDQRAMIARRLGQQQHPMYQVVTDDNVNAKVAALPDDLLVRYSRPPDLLELPPWSSEPYSHGSATA